MAKIKKGYKGVDGRTIIGHDNHNKATDFEVNIFSRIHVQRNATIQCTILL